MNDVPAKVDHVLNHFPNRRRHILELRLSSPDFADTCDDFNEICDLLQRTEAEVQEDTTDEHEFRRLRDDLKSDLLETLTKYDQEHL